MAQEGHNPRSTAAIGGHPLHPLLVTVPIGGFAGALLLDLLFWSSPAESYATASLWLLGAGLVGALAAAATGLADFFGEPRIRALNDAWLHAGGNILIVLIEVFSFSQRYRFGAAAIVPLGLTLSVVSVLLLLFTGWKGGELVFRHRVGVRDDGAP